MVYGYDLHEMVFMMMYLCDEMPVFTNCGSTIAPTLA